MEFLESIVAETGEQPAALLDQPTLNDEMHWYLDCFGDLNRDRPYTQGYPLPLTTQIIEFYRRMYRLPDRDDFHRYIRMIDDIYLSEVSKKREAESKKTT